MEAPGAQNEQPAPGWPPKILSWFVYVLVAGMALALAFHQPRGKPLLSTLATAPGEAAHAAPAPSNARSPKRPAIPFDENFSGEL